MVLSVLCGIYQNIISKLHKISLFEMFDFYIKCYCSCVLVLVTHVTHALYSNFKHGPMYALYVKQAKQYR